MSIEYRTARSSVAEVIDHTAGNATQELVAALEVALITDRGRELSEENRRIVLATCDNDY